MCVVVEISVGPVVLPAGMGSFDFVRLAPHFAQEDRHLLVNKISAGPLARAVYGEVLATLRVDVRSAFGADPGSLAASLRKSSAI